MLLYGDVLLTCTVANSFYTEWHSKYELNDIINYKSVSLNTSYVSIA